jgi:hypothetical protein
MPLIYGNNFFILPPRKKKSAPEDGTPAYTLYSFAILRLTTPTLVVLCCGKLPLFAVKWPILGSKKRLQIYLQGRKNKLKHMAVFISATLVDSIR